MTKFAARSQSDQARVDNLRCGRLEGRTLHLEVDEEGASMARFLSGQGPKIEDLIKRATGHDLKVVIDTKAHETRRPAVTADQLEDVQQLPGVARALELFDASVVDVRPEEENPTDV